MKRTFVLDASNISARANVMVRTGIQEVVYQTFVHMIEARAAFPDVEFVSLPFLPRRAGDLISSDLIVPHPELDRGLLEAVEDRLRLPSKEIWGFDLRASGFQMSEEKRWEHLARADFIHLQGLVNCAPLVSRLRELKPEKKISISMTIYDLIPAVVPEYCNSYVSRMYNLSYLPALGRFIDHAICISRHTALDLIAQPETSRIPYVSVLGLPFDFPSGASPKEGLLGRFALAERGYVLFLGSLEPRKNLRGLLEGFERFIADNPGSGAKLVLVGSTGWKNRDLERRLEASTCSSRIVRTGYLDDGDLNRLIECAGAVAMLSHYEGYGLPIAQAYSKGVPVIATYSTSLPEACGGDGIFVSPWDLRSVAAGIGLALEQSVAGARAVSSHVLERSWSNYCLQLARAIFNRADLESL